MLQQTEYVSQKMYTDCIEHIDGPGVVNPCLKAFRIAVSKRLHALFGILQLTDSY